MDWTIEYSKTAVEQLGRLDTRTARRLLAYGDELAQQQNPRQLGQPLSGPIGTFWSFRLETRALICDVQDKEARLLVLRLRR